MSSRRFYKTLLCLCRPWKKWSKYNLARYCILLSVISFGCFLLVDRLFPFPLPAALGGSGKDLSQIVTDRHGLPLRVFADNNGVWRYPVSLDDISPLYKEALINYEDRWFYYHPGVNPLSLVRAAGQWLVNGRVISGGSTLTMQTARVLDPHSRTLTGKLKQIFRALQLEWHFSKDEILSLYVNYAPFGGTIEGVQAASFVYLDKPASQLTEAEAALLAVLPQAPSRYRPERYPDKATSARNKVIKRLHSYGVWSDTQSIQALKEPVVAQYNMMPMHAALLARRLKQRYPKEQVIHSTVDQDLQQSLQGIARDYVQSLEVATSSAILVMDNRKGEVLAYIASADFRDDARFGHVDMIRAIRSPGSTLKPFIYAMALGEGVIHEKSLLSDVPSRFQDYAPENFHQGFSGPVTTRWALQQSLNVPAVQVLNDLGSKKFYAKSHSGGLPIKLRRGAEPNLSMALGGVGLNLESLVSAYSAFTRQGWTIRPKLTFSESSTAKKLLSSQAAWITYDIMSELSLNTSYLRRFTENKRRSLAWKTGTSYGYRDAWVIATNKRVTIGVWIGKPDGSASFNNYGRKMAVPLLEQVVENLPLDWFNAPEKPDGLAKETICWPLGGLKKYMSQSDCHIEKSAWLIDYQAPNTLQVIDEKPWSSLKQTLFFEPDGTLSNGDCRSSAAVSKNIVLWPQSIQPWLEEKWQDKTLLPPISSQCSPAGRVGQNLTVSGIKTGDKLYAIAGEEPTIELKLRVSGCRGKLTWYYNGNYSKTSDCSDESSFVISEEGPQQLVVVDETGVSERINFSFSG